MEYILVNEQGQLYAKRSTKLYEGYWLGYVFTISRMC